MPQFYHEMQSYLLKRETQKLPQGSLVCVWAAHMKLGGAELRTTD